MTLGVILLDMLEIRCLPKSRMLPVHRSQPVFEKGVGVADGAEIAFEVLDVDDVEADERCVGADVEFGDLRAEDVGAGV